MAEVVTVGGAVAVVVAAAVTEYHLPAALLLQWHLTDRCNLHCRHCYGTTSGDELPFSDLLCIFEQFLHLVASCRSRSRGRRLPAHITVTGGEPFLRDDFFPLLETFHHHRTSCSFALLTNGNLIDRKIARRLQALSPTFVQVSVEGGKETHDRIRGAGDFDHVVAGIRELRREGVPVLISFTASRCNFREFPAVAALGRRLGVRRVWADRFIPLGVAEGAREQVLSPEETREFFTLMRHSRRSFFRRGTEISLHRALQFLEGEGRPYRCTAGDELITILPNGDLAPCRRLPLVVGNVMTTPLVDLYRESPLFRRLRGQRAGGDCAGCLYERACGGGLRCLAHALTGSLDLKDPGCWLQAGC